MKRRGIVLLALIMTLALLASLFSIPVAGAEEPVNYAAQQSYWKTDSIGYAATSFSEDGMKMTAQETAMAFNQKVKADSKIKFVFEGHGNREGWGGMYIMLKADDGVPYDAPKEPALTKKDTSTGNWLAFAFGASWSTYFIESDDGAVQLTEKAEVSGYDTWYFKAQTTTVEIETKDTDSGVDMSVTFFASGDESNTGIAQTVTYSSDNMALQGDYSVVVGGYIELYEGQDITLATMEASLAETETPVTEAENLAVSSDYYSEIARSSVCFQFGADGIGFYDTQFGAMVSNQTIAADATISFDIAGTLTNGEYGNFYLVFKNEKKSYTFKESISVCGQRIPKILNTVSTMSTISFPVISARIKHRSPLTVHGRRISGKMKCLSTFWGDRGGARLTYGGHFTFYTTDENNTLQKIEYSYNIPNHIQCEDDAFLKAVRSGEHTKTYIDEILESAKLLDALYKSADQKCELKL